MVQAVGTSAILEAIKNMQNVKLNSNGGFILNNTISVEEKSEAEYAELAQNTYNDIINSYTFKPNSKEEYMRLVNSQMSYKIGNMTDSDFISKHSASQNLISSLDIDAEFNNYMKNKGCSSVEELQALNKTFYKEVSDIKTAAEGRVIGILHNLDREKMPYAMDISKSLIENVDIATLNKFIGAGALEANDLLKGFIDNYSGDEVTASQLALIKKEYASFMGMQENKYKSTACDVKPEDQLNRIDFSRYSDNYGEKYVQNLILKYEETA